MAYEINGQFITLKSSGDMSSGQYHLVNATTTNSADGCILGPSSQGGHVIGVWQDNSTAATHGKVQVSGVAKIQVSTATEAISLGEILTGSTASIGRVIASTSTTGHFVVVGKALAAVASGSSAIIPVLLGIGTKLDHTA